MKPPEHFMLVTCEHGGRRVPTRYRHLFAGREHLLADHRGGDAGALAMARDLARAFDAPLAASTVSRALVDLNRSLHHPRLFSEATRMSPDEVRREIIARHYLPYRTGMEARIAEAVTRGRRIIHISSHSFTPVLDGEPRNADVGLLYDPGRPGEVALCRHWQARLAQVAPELRVRRNYPYTGRSDGFATYLRRRFLADWYVGIELEINQAVVGAARRWSALRSRIVDTLQNALNDLDEPSE